MPYRFAASTSGPLAKLAGSLSLPASLALTSTEPHHVWALLDRDQPSGLQEAFAILPSAALAAVERFEPRFRSVDDWLPGMTLLMERSTEVRAAASAEVSAVWTSLAAPFKSTITGDIGLDLDLGLRAQAQWSARSDCWWSLSRPGRSPLLRVRLCAGRNNAKAINVKAVAVAGLDQATQNSVAAILGQHRNQLLAQLRQGARQLLDKLAVPEAAARQFLDHWLTLPAAVQAADWRNPVNPILAALKSAVESTVDTTLAQADQLAARLEFAAVRTMEKGLEASVSAMFDRRQAQDAILDADFDFAANPALQPVLDRCLAGDLNAVLDGPVSGVTVHTCAITRDSQSRRTIAWRLPFSTGFVSSRDRLMTAMEALDDASGRILRANVKAESERQTRYTSSLLAIEAGFGARLGNDVQVHDPAALTARFTLEMRTNRPLALQPLLDIYGAGKADRNAKYCRLEVSLPPEALAQWLEPQDAADVSRRLQKAWRELLPAAIDLDAMTAQTAAPLLVWASLPVSTAARCTAKGLEINRKGSPYWDWMDRELLQAMVWNPRTRAALEARLDQTHITATPDEMRRAVAAPVGAAVFSSLLYTEAAIIDRLTAALARVCKSSTKPVEKLRNISTLAGGLTSAFHGKLTSIYGPESARALGPMLLRAASPVSPEVKVTWTR